MSFALAHEVVADFEANATGDAACSMACHEQIVRAFRRIGVAHQATLGADGMKLLVSSCDQLVWVNLVASVPDQPVEAEIVSQMESDTELNNAQVTGKMCWACREYAHQLVTDFLRQLLELRLVQTVKVSRGFYAREQ